MIIKISMLQTQFHKISSNHELNDKNCIKVVFDKYMNALYFSRSKIPNSNFNNNLFMFKQVCIITFKRSMLLKYLKMKHKIRNIRVD